MTMASGLLEATTPRPLDAWVRSEVRRPDGPSTFLSFAQSGWPSMGALALAVAAMHPDELLAARIRGAVDPEVQLRGAAWLTTMNRITITGTLVQTDPLNDGENVMVSWRWPDGGTATASVYVDHNLGTIVKDAFVVPKSGDEIAALYASMNEPRVTTQPIDRADARARIAEAIETGDHSVPPIETESWPACRPMVEWLLRQLRAGGSGYIRPEWPEADREQLLNDFLQSPFATVDGLTHDQLRDVANPLLWFGCDYGPGDPLRWSPVSVEIVLSDWYPRKVFSLAYEEMSRVPDVVAAFARYSHQRRGIPKDLTDETVAAVEHWRGEFARAIQQPGRSPESNAAWLAHIAAGFGPDEIDDDGFDDSWEGLDHAAYMQRTVIELEAAVTDLVGGPAAYEALTDVPLDDVPFDWARVPVELRAPTAETLEQLDRWASALFDDEVRTIARAVLVGIVDADRAVFKRSDRTDSLAAAILWFLSMRLTGRFSARERRAMPWAVFTQKDLAAATGVPVSSISSRAKAIANIVDRADIDWPSILHSTQRREALRTKQIVADWCAGNA